MGGLEALETEMTMSNLAPIRWAMLAALDEAESGLRRRLTANLRFQAINGHFASGLEARPARFGGASILGYIWALKIAG